jgi:dephospho-CoA kinase
VHPEVRKEELRLLKLYENEPLVILDVPLLFENKMEHLVDGIIVVVIDENVRKERLMRRDKCSEEDIKKRLSHQMSQEEKTKKADYVINNSSSLNKTINQINNILKKLDEKFFNKKGVLVK